MVIVAKRKREKTDFGARLRSLREAAGLTQGQLGDRAEMAYQAVARLERGAAEPNWPTVLKLADALGVSVAAFRDESPDDDQTEIVDDPDRDEGKRK